MKNVLVLESSLQEHTIAQINAIEGLSCTFTTAQEVTDEQLADAHIIVGAVKPEMVEKAPNLEMVQLFSAGANTFTWLPEHIVLANAYGGYGAGISEHMLATTLMCMKLFPEYMEQQKEHVWGLIPGIQLIDGAKVVSVGMGGIGTAFLEKCHALGAECYGVRRSLHDKPEFVKELYTMDTMDEILKEADVVALSMPETPETVHLFNEERLRKIKKGAILMNVGRGSAINEIDLIKLCNEDYFRAVCLDVTETEPLPRNNPLWNTPHVYITPHISGGFRSRANYENVMRTVVTNLENAAEGKAPLHIVDRKLGY